MKKLIPALLFLNLFSACSDRSNQAQFTEIPYLKSNLKFANNVPETADWNIIKYLYFFNGGGVAVGDINNDGLPDIAFSANQMPNKLFLNKGEFKFEDITEKSNFIGYNGTRSWKTGISMADVNADGWLDIYVCHVGYYKFIMNGRNELFINQKDGTFKEMAKEYGLAFKGFSQQASWFDYDLDGDLDMFLLNHSVHSPAAYGEPKTRSVRDSMGGDRLFRNDGNVFKEVGKEAGIYSGAMGYGLSATIGDLDQNGCPDIYVSNDFHENDYLYLNNCDGTFKESIKSAMGHISNFSMGNDMADINNDGWLDVLSLDMKPEDETILKSSLGVDHPNLYFAKIKHGYHEQQPRNNLQLNRGVLGESGLQFSEIGQFAGIDATDWSWSALMADFDNDGWKDVFITNGIPKRPNDQDYLKFTSNNRQQRKKISELETASKMPSGQMANYVFKNQQNTIPTFENVSQKWGLDLYGCSHGAAYADFDNDGDLDLVVNNLNAAASIYRNNAEKTDSNNYLKIKISGTEKNPFAIGTKAEIIIGNKKQVQEISPTRGWQSSVDYLLNFGLGKSDKIDELIITYPDGNQQVKKNIPANQLIEIKYPENNYSKKEKENTFIFKDITKKTGIDFIHQENQYLDFDKEVLIPHLISREGPAVAVGDVNNDGFDDIYLGGAKSQTATLFLQKKDGTFLQKNIPDFAKDYLHEDVGAVFFDANHDQHLDLIVISGGGEHMENTPELSDRLYINNGNGNFNKKENALPEINANGSCVVAADFNADGAIDLFIGSRAVPGAYGQAPNSFLLFNDGRGNFKMAGKNYGEWPTPVGMVTDAIWQKDEKKLIVVGEWMPVTIFDFKNKKSEKTIIPNTEGWWNTIYSADMDNDGDLDLLAGNMGLNSNLKASVEKPVELFLKDYDDNNQSDPILTYFRHGKKWTLAGKDDLEKQIPPLKKRFVQYEAFANRTFSEVFTDKESSVATYRKAVTFASTYFENKGNNNYHSMALPLPAQISPINSFLTMDIDKDRNMDILAVGNFRGNHPSLGPFDASYGNYLKGNGSGQFSYVEPMENGFAVKGDAREIQLIKNHEKELILVAKNNSGVQLFERETQTGAKEQEN